MERVSNPRFPHWCRIIRKTVEHPLVDEDDSSPLDCYEPESEQATVVYEGICRSYEKNTTSDKGDVVTSNRGLSLPFALNKWNAIGIIPREGDEVAVCKGVYTEYGRVVDVNPGNFHGTHIVWRYDRN